MNLIFSSGSITVAPLEKPDQKVSNAAFKTQPNVSVTRGEVFYPDGNTTDVLTGWCELTFALSGKNYEPMVVPSVV